MKYGTNNSLSSLWRNSWSESLYFWFWEKFCSIFRIFYIFELVGCKNIAFPDLRRVTKEKNNNNGQKREIGRAKKLKFLRQLYCSQYLYLVNHYSLMINCWQIFFKSKEWLIGQCDEFWLKKCKNVKELSKICILTKNVGQIFVTAQIG